MYSFPEKLGTTECLSSPKVSSYSDFLKSFLLLSILVKMVERTATRCGLQCCNGNPSRVPLKNA